MIAPVTALAHKTIIHPDCINGDQSSHSTKSNIEHVYTTNHDNARRSPCDAVVVATATSQVSTKALGVPLLL